MQTGSRDPNKDDHKFALCTCKHVYACVCMHVNVGSQLSAVQICLYAHCHVHRMHCAVYDKSTMPGNEERQG